MKYLLTGGTGVLGKELQKNVDFISPCRKEMDITEDTSVMSILKKYSPDLIVHAAAYTNVNAAEKQASDAKLCYTTNVIGTKNIVKFSKCPIIFISTETCLNPYNFYSITKLKAEHEIKKHNYKYQIFRIGMKKNPFPYDVAPSDMYTIADYPDIIAKKICDNLEKLENRVLYLGTGIKTMYELAIRTRDVKKISLKDISFPIEDQKQFFLLDKNCFL
jgi:nucleoside-diphosphate-sugar epimerase